MVTAAAFIEKVRIPLAEGWGYIYGTWGSTWTQAKQNAATREMTVKYGSRWIGKKVTDCSGLLRRALYWLGESIVHQARYQYTDFCPHKGALKAGRREDGTLPLPGSAVFLQGSQAHIHHVGVYVGGDTVIEAKGTIYGVVTSHLSHWDHWGELKMVDYSDAASLETSTQINTDPPEDAAAGTILRAVATNPNQWLNMRSGAGSQYPVVCQIPRGAEVELLDAGEPEWWQVRYGGRIGWAFAKYLTPAAVQPDDDTDPSEYPDPPAPDPAPDPQPDLPAPDPLQLLDAAITALGTLRDLLQGGTPT